MDLSVKSETESLDPAAVLLAKNGWRKQTKNH